MQEAQEAQVPSLVQEDPLEKEMSAHSSILATRIPWTEEPGGVRSSGSQLDTTEHSTAQQQVLVSFYFMHSNVYIGEGNGTPLQYSCLENPMDGGAW